VTEFDQNLLISLDQAQLRQLACWSRGRPLDKFIDVIDFFIALTAIPRSLIDLHLTLRWRDVRPHVELVQLV
jgi:hypothetical protein